MALPAFHICAPVVVSLRHDDARRMGTKKASRQGGFLVVDKERCYFFMMRVVAMPLAVATRTTYTPGARLSTLACCPTVVATRLPAAL